MQKECSKVCLPDELLLQVEKPARYTGYEWNAIYKPKARCDAAFTRFAFCFPDTYEIGMSNIGLRILYDVINRRDDASCERVFAPWTDMERLMRERRIPLFALESRDVLGVFDFVAFTLQYELCYSNVLNMLDLSGIPLFAEARGNEFPIVMAGGPCVCNPAPMARFFDLFVAGEGEEVINELLDIYSRMKAASRTSDSRADASAGATPDGGATPDEGASLDGGATPDSEATPDGGATLDDGVAPNGRATPDGGATPCCVDKNEFLFEASKIEGVYVPLFPPEQGRKVKKRIVRDINNAIYPERGIVPNIEIIHDRVILELFRGCIHGCRFCQAGYIYRPVREKAPSKLLAQASGLVCATGYDEITLSSLSTSDYSDLAELTENLVSQMGEKRVNISLPSLRVDNFSLGLAKTAVNIRKSGLTFAPEAGTQRLRDVINKGVSEEDLLHSAALAFESGWGSIKLYFMIGLPTETMEDLDGIAELVRKVVDLYKNTPKEKRARDLSINVSAASFIPKPFTPFQWEAQDDIATLKHKQLYLRDALKQKYVKFNWHDAHESFLEAVFARGGPEIGDALYEAWKTGAKFDGWSEHFNFENWLAAFKAVGLCPEDYANRLRGVDEPLPWDIMDYGIDKEFLISERERAYAGKLTTDCRAACHMCGISQAFGCDACIGIARKAPAKHICISGSSLPEEYN